MPPRHLWTLAAVCLGAAIHAAAAPLAQFPIGDRFLDVQYVAGEGDEISFVVVDFAETGGQAYAFGYRWDVPTSGFAMLQAIAEEGGLAVDATEFDFGQGPTFLVDNLTYEHRGTLEVGDPNRFWRYDTGVYEQGLVAWSTSGAGASDRMIAANSFDGWYNLNTFPPGDIIQPVRLPTSALLTADFDTDGDVDHEDLARWQEGFGTPSAASQADGDANGDRQVAGDDFLGWQAQFGAGPANGQAVGAHHVPETATQMLAMIVAVCFTGRRRRSPQVR